MFSLLSYVGGGEDEATAFCRRQVRRMTRAFRGLARGSAGCGQQPTASRGVLVSFKESTDLDNSIPSTQSTRSTWLKCPLVCANVASVQLAPCANSQTVLDGGTGFLKAGYAGQVRQRPYTSTCCPIHTETSTLYRTSPSSNIRPSSAAPSSVPKSRPV
jgi:hypothetical protein